GTAELRASYVDTSLIQLDDLADDGEPDALPRHALVRALAALEQPLRVLRVDAAAVVLDHDRDAIGIGPQRPLGADAHAVPAIFVRVLHHVAQELGQVAGVAAEHGFGRHVELALHSLVAIHLVERSLHVRRERRHGDGLDAD